MRKEQVANFRNEMLRETFGPEKDTVGGVLHKKDPCY